MLAVFVSHKYGDLTSRPTKFTQIYSKNRMMLHKIPAGYNVPSFCLFQVANRSVHQGPVIIHKTVIAEK